MSKQPTLFEEDEIEICDALTLEEANPLAFKILSLVDAHCNKIQVVGSIRRQKPIVRDIDFVCIAKSLTEWRKVGKELEYMLGAKLNVEGKTVSGDKIKRILVPFVRGYVQVDFYNCTPETWGIYELIRTGSADHNIWLARYALRNKMQLKYSVGLVDKAGQVIASKDEKAIFRALGFEWIPAPQREMKGGKPVWRE